jgi:hypothetical protein
MNAAIALRPKDVFRAAARATELASWLDVLVHVLRFRAGEELPSYASPNAAGEMTVGSPRQKLRDHY